MRLLVVSLLFTSFLFADKDGWKYEKSSGGVTAYTRTIPTSSFKEYKVETEVDATLSQVVAVLMDVPAMPQWVDRCSSASMLKEISSTESITRSITAAPFPLKNREAIAHGKLVQDKITKVVVLTSSGRSSYLPPDPRYERVKHVRGLWVLEPKPNGKVHIKMIGHTDPGGVIPAAIANQFVVTVPFNTIKNLRNQIKKPKYINQKLSYIKN
ncbi:MAG TPA: START domain-containing protein [Turneriella sp.]|nr:START domain-containing protein [Turneriella sp.]